MTRKRSKAHKRPAVLAAGKQQAVESQSVGMAQAIQDWLAKVWDDVVSFASQIWESVKGLCAFARDLGRLVWYWLFRSDEFVVERARFQLKYLSVQIDPAQLASALAVSLNAR